MPRHLRYVVDVAYSLLGKEFVTFLTVNPNVLSHKYIMSRLNIRNYFHFFLFRNCGRFSFLSQRSIVFNQGPG